MPTLSGIQIVVDEGGVAWIGGTTTKVVEVALDRTALGLSPEAIHEQHPHLTMEQIQAALAYYDAHKAEVDADIERRRQRVEELQSQAQHQVSRQELLART